MSIIFGLILIANPLIAALALLVILAILAIVGGFWQSSLPSGCLHDRTPLFMSLNPPPAFHVLAKPTGAICNLACRYCFYLKCEHLYPESRFRMSDEVLESYIRQYLGAQQAPEATIAWQGGEPTLMGLEFFRRSVELAERYKMPGMRVAYTIQTNGPRLTSEWCEFFRENNVLVGISIDGPRSLHDVFRVDRQGRG